MAVTARGEGTGRPDRAGPGRVSARPGNRSREAVIDD